MYASIYASLFFLMMRVWPHLLLHLHLKCVWRHIHLNMHSYNLHLNTHSFIIIIIIIIKHLASRTLE